MQLRTRVIEAGLVLRRDGSYELALYRRSGKRRIRFKVDPALAWAIGGALDAPFTHEAFAVSPDGETPDED